MLGLDQPPSLRRPLAVLALVSLLAAGAAPARADEAPATQPAQYAPMPWHLVDLWWDVGRDVPFESLAVDVSVSDDIPASANVYIAPIGLGQLSKTQFYGGLQTNADGATRKDPSIRPLGPGFIFSMWGERSLDAIRPADGGYLQSSGHEGDFVSARRPHAWTKGTYTYRLSRMDQETVNGETFTWVGAFVNSHDTNENFFVGALRFKGEKLVLDRRIANFIEIYGAPRPVSKIPKLTITFGPPIINGQASQAVSAEATYPQGVPDYADSKQVNGSVAVSTGSALPARVQRVVRLIDLTK